MIYQYNVGNWNNLKFTEEDCFNKIWIVYMRKISEGEFPPIPGVAITEVRVESVLNYSMSPNF